MSRLQERYAEVVHPELMKEFGLHHKMQVPRIQKDRRQHGVARGGGRMEKKIGRGGRRT